MGAACSDIEVSELASALDDRARQFGVLFVIASGNMSARPFRAWPPTGEAMDDRIRPPADAIRGVTVGGLAHIETASTLVMKEHPSPFSRRGPAVGGLTKPELTHYAGNIDAAGQYLQTGIISIDGTGHIAENVGTSFACPLVSAIAGSTYRELEVPGAALSILQLKAMLIHSAFMKRAPLDPLVVNYHGIGTPSDVREILNCHQSSATVAMHFTVRPGRLFEKSPFPMPSCLIKDGRLQGEIFMTLLSDCPVERGFGLEYCRTNVTASLGTLHDTKRDKKGRPAYTRQVVPALAGMGDELTEEIFDQGFRWSPLKLYHRRFIGGPDLPWRLRVEAINRAEHTDTRDQDVVLLLTIQSAVETDRVYDELVREMQTLAWNVIDLPVRSRIRERSQG
jgi:hypothetical protein